LAKRPVRRIAYLVLSNHVLHQILGMQSVEKFVPQILGHEELFWFLFSCCRFCFFPQEIVLELQQPSRIINMQLLCHEFKVSSCLSFLFELQQVFHNL
jgi:hypothetical protein